MVVDLLQGWKLTEVKKKFIKKFKLRVDKISNKCYNKDTKKKREVVIMRKLLPDGSLIEFAFHPETEEEKKKRKERIVKVMQKYKIKGF